MSHTPDLIQQITGLTTEEWVVAELLWKIIKFTITVWILRWIFQVRKNVEMLEEISRKIDTLKKEHSEIQTPKRTPEEMREIYGDKAND